MSVVTNTFTDHSDCVNGARLSAFSHLFSATLYFLTSEFVFVMPSCLSLISLSAVPY